MNLDKIIKKLELNESTISTILGGLVLMIVTFLLVNYFTEQPQQVAQDSQQATESGKITGAISATSTQRYVVQEGDSLWKIAQEHYGDGYKWVDIMEANHMQNPDVIVPGKEIDLPQIKGVERISASENQDPEASLEELELTETKTDAEKRAELATKTYEVKRGDYLFKIAREVYGDQWRWTEILEANRDQIQNPQILVVGQLLTIP